MIIDIEQIERIDKFRTQLDFVFKLEAYYNYYFNGKFYIY
jgi:hypothetical protein